MEEPEEDGGWWCCDMLSSGHDMVTTLMNPQHLWLPEPDAYKIKPA